MKEQRPEDYAGDEQEVSLDQLAGTAARRIIRSTGIEDTTEHWRALKAAFITGYDSARDEEGG
jgi:hypothetical protein